MQAADQGGSGFLWSGDRFWSSWAARRVVECDRVVSELLDPHGPPPWAWNQTLLLSL